MHRTCQIGRIIRSYRKKSNLTIEKVAELCDMSVRGYVKIELGDSDPKWNTLSKIITVLEILKVVSSIFRKLVCSPK